MMKNFSKNKGYALLETVFYISLFAILSVAVIYSLVQMTKSFRQTIIQAELTQGSDILEKISREIRKANGINTLSTNSLKLNTTDEAGNSRTVQFSLNGSNVQFYENDTLIGNLNSANVAVSGLNFSQLNGTRSVAVRVTLSLRANRDATNRIEDFYNTIVLRGGY